MMRPLRSSRPWAWISPHEAALMVLAAMLPITGCGGLVVGEPPKTEAQAKDEQKVQALMKQGKSLTEVRAIMKGEPLTAKKSKKASRKH